MEFNHLRVNLLMSLDYLAAFNRSRRGLLKHNSRTRRKTKASQNFSEMKSFVENSVFNKCLNEATAALATLAITAKRKRSAKIIVDAE